MGSLLRDNQRDPYGFQNTNACTPKPLLWGRNIATAALSPLVPPLTASGRSCFDG